MLFIGAATLAAATTATLAVEFSDADVENLVKRSDQYVAMYNVNNKFALKQGGGNACDPDTELKARRNRRSRGPATARSTSVVCWTCARIA